MREFSVSTHTEQELREITDEVQRIADECGWADGLCFVSCPHTTAGITINERADPAVAADLVSALEAMVPHVPWSHAEGNSPAHLKASLVGSGCLVGIESGRLSLGRWQGIFLCEFDGPRSRTVRIWFVS